MRANTVVLLGLLTPVVSVIGQASAATRAGTSVHCSWRAAEKAPPFRLDGIYVGSVQCNRPFGSGRYRDHYQVDLTFTPPTASAKGSPKLSFTRGTVHGMSQISGRISGKPYNYRGTFRIVGGTGQFKHVSGTLKLSCTVRPPTEDCRASGTVNGI